MPRLNTLCGQKKSYKGKTITACSHAEAEMLIEQQRRRRPQQQQQQQFLYGMTADSHAHYVNVMLRKRLK